MPQCHSCSKNQSEVPLMTGVCLDPESGLAPCGDVIAESCASAKRSGIPAATCASGEKAGNRMTSYLSSANRWFLRKTLQRL